MATALLLSGCAAPATQTAGASKSAVVAEVEQQQFFAVDERIREEGRLLSVAAPILANNADLCGKRVRGLTGMWLWNEYSIEKEARAKVSPRYGLTDALHVKFVVAGSPAQIAGLAAGDQIVQVNGRNMPRGKDALVEYSTVMGKLLRENPTRSINLVIRRAGHVYSAAINPILSCDYPITLMRSETINAYADGDNLMVTTAMLQFARSDEELALIIGHELAHNVMDHSGSQKQNQIAGGVGGFLVEVLFAGMRVNTGGAFTRAGAAAGQSAYSADFEREADYVGLYMIARAGYQIENAISVWRRMGANSPRSIAHGTTHPPTAERFVALDNAIREIRYKQAAGQPLRPNPKR